MLNRTRRNSVTYGRFGVVHQRHAHARVMRYRESKGLGAGEGMAPDSKFAHGN